MGHEVNWQLQYKGLKIGLKQEAVCNDDRS